MKKANGRMKGRGGLASVLRAGGIMSLLAGVIATARGTAVNSDGITADPALKGMGFTPATVAGLSAPQYGPKEFGERWAGSSRQRKRHRKIRNANGGSMPKRFNKAGVR